MIIAENVQSRWFGKRRVKTLACVLAANPPVAAFLEDALQDQGFIIDTGAQSLTEIDTDLIDLALIAFSSVGSSARDALEFLGNRLFEGSVMLFGPPSISTGSALQELGEALGLNMLPILSTPFSETQLKTNVSGLVRDPPAPPPVNADEAVRSGWLELWYQTKLDVRSLTTAGAEGLVRIRHPTWGIVPPAYFIPAKGDPGFSELSEFVIGRVLEDWRYFAENGQKMKLAINIPWSFLEQPNTIRLLHDLLPQDPSFEGIVFEINAADIIRNLPFACDVANELRFYNVGVAIDDVGANWPGLLEAATCPFVELKIDRQFVNSSSSDSLKRIVCGQIVEFALQKGVRSVAVGVENVADFHTMRLLNVSEVQGFLFGRPAPVNKLARSLALVQPLDQYTDG